jgi:hypothetical protein
VKSFIFRSHSQISLADEVKENEVGKECGTHGRENYIKLLEAKLEGKRPLGKPKHRWEFGIKMNRKKIGWGFGLDLDDSV